MLVFSDNASADLQTALSTVDEGLRDFLPRSDFPIDELSIFSSFPRTVKLTLF
jgi:hypothetical protein